MSGPHPAKNTLKESKFITKCTVTQDCIKNFAFFKIKIY
jgi:hypothetical protein